VDRSEGPTPIAEAIRQLLHDVAEPTGIATHLDDRLDEEPTPEARTVVYRIVNEALINVVQHAHPRSIVISVSRHECGVLVTIEDNGKGFDPVEALDLSAEHLGLQVMRERAQMSGGWLRADSAIGFGTTIAFWIPSSTRTPRLE
jgi:signal transduction histidine kinase